ncbi:MAG: phasin family protein [Pseudomonadota bacterium]
MATKTTKQVETLAAEAQKSVEQNVEKMQKSMEDVAGYGQQNFDAIVESGRVAAKAVEGINAEIMALSKKSYEDGLAAAKEMTSAKSVTEYFEKQTAYTKASIDTMVDAANRMADLFSTAAKDAAAPITERVNASTELFRTVNA